ncbi:MAG: hypothetical protein CVU63_09845 [Deltaproteobacteria bacterium HGW-Deltaproteobacteria-20]|nr:MAG: hypothetical protein CVU63_09845 [Deltaproteobacteria bacterium HGW-Deltaproteobacteria-20]
MLRAAGVRVADSETFTYGYNYLSDVTRTRVANDGVVEPGRRPRSTRRGDTLQCSNRRCHGTCRDPARRSCTRAYALQDQGLDTVEANLALGFRDDERHYAVAAHMLDSTGVKSVKLMTNNPNKIRQLEGYGVTVSGRIPHLLPPNPHCYDGNMSPPAGTDCSYAGSGWGRFATAGHSLDGTEPPSSWSADPFRIWGTTRPEEIVGVNPQY